MGIAPFDVVVVPTNAADQQLIQTAQQIAEALEKQGYDVILDDRDERAGVKFKDADLVGIPFRINVGKKVSEGKVELVRRSTRESQDANIAAITEEFRKLAAGA
jgi:prolyl-tRNA synthetase